MTDTNIFQLAQPGTFADRLTEVLCNGARALLAQAVETEVAGFLADHAVKLIARVEATERGTDVRFVVTNLPGRAKLLYEKVYCARGRMENMIKEHKLYTRSDRTSCHRWEANQFRLFLHTGAYWLLHQLRQAAPRRSPWRAATFETLRRAFLKIAVRIEQLKSRIKITLPSAYPYRKALIAMTASIAAQGP